MAAEAAALLLACGWLVAAVAALAIAVVVHELAHLLTARFLGLAAEARIGPAAILRVLDPRPPGHLASSWAHLPCTRIVLGSCEHGVRGNLAPGVCWARHAGWLTSMALAAAAIAAHGEWAARAPPIGAALLHGAAVACTLVAACALPADGFGIGMPGISSEACSLPLFCGNLGLLLASVTGAGDTGIDEMDVLERQCAVSMMRGAQSGGLMTLVSHGNVVNGVRVRVAPNKRRSLAVLLSRRFRLMAGNAHHAAGHGIFLGHTRFATSSIPLPSESHPHQWTPTSPVTLWRADATASGGIARAQEHFGVYITHNGDYDLARDPLGHYRTHQEAAAFLTAVLGSPAPAKCDSICIAGMMELHRTQGIWAASLRLAVAEVARVPFERIAAAGAPGGGVSAGAGAAAPADGDLESGGKPGLPFPSPAELIALGSALDEAFGAFLLGRRGRQKPTSSAHGEEEALQGLQSDDGLEKRAKGHTGCGEEWRAQRRPVAPGLEARCLLSAIGGPAGMAELQHALELALLGALLSLGPAGGRRGAKLDRLPAWLGAASVGELAGAALENFIHADLYTALVRVMRAAKDSFGVATACTLDPDRICLAAWNQPMAVGLCPELGAAVYGSETEVVMLNLLRGGGDTASPAQPNGWRQGHCTLRIDLDDGGGEALQLVLAGPEAGVGAGAAAGCEDSGDGWAVAPDRPGGGFVRLRVYSVRQGAEVPGLAAFQAAGRVVPLTANPYISFSAIDLTPGHDAVAADIADIPRLLHTIAQDWADPGSCNRRSGAAFAAVLRHIAEERRRRAACCLPGGDDAWGQEVDVLLVGVEVSLWLAEQFAADLKTLLPGLRVAAVSANKVVGVLGSNRGRVPATGFPFCRTSARLDGAVVLVVSHSGQTFPTIQATRLLHAMMPGRVFVMSGSTDTKMSFVLGQRLSPGSPFCERAFDTKAGWRSAEPASASVVATAHNMTELLLLIGATLCAASTSSGDGSSGDCPSSAPSPGRRPSHPPRPPFGLALSAEQLLDLRIARDAFVEQAAPALTGVGPCGAPAPSLHHEALVAAGRRWALHLLEGPWAWALSAAYIAATVISGHPLVRTVVDAIAAAAGAAASTAAVLAHVALVFDAAIYIWCGILAATGLRLLQRRPLLARWGRRTLVVADVPYVNQCTEAFVSKLFALSYGIASLDVHGANPADHLVHKFTHRVARGTLLAVGRPDGRLYSQTQAESWILLGLLQAKVITSLGTQPELLTLGHNPYKNEYIDTHVVLPTTRPKGLAELLHLDCSKGPNGMFAARSQMRAAVLGGARVSSAIRRHRTTKLLEEAGRLAGSDAAADSEAAAKAAGAPDAELCNLTRSPTAIDLTDTPLGGFRSREASTHAGNLHRVSVTASRTPSGALLTYGAEVHVLGEHYLASGGGRGPATPNPAPARMHSAASTPDASNSHAGASAARAAAPAGAEVAGGRAGAVPEEAAAALAAAAAAAEGSLGALASGATRMLEEQGVIEALLESRFLSLERLIAFFVMFHAMAAHVAGAGGWPLRYDISRSQSGLRIATTASPVTAAEVERTLAEVAAEREGRGARGRRAAVAARWRSAAERAVRLRKLKRL